MPVYQIYKKDGSPVNVEGPPNATWEQLAQIYTQQKKSTTRDGGRYIPESLLSTGEEKEKDFGVFDHIGAFRRGIGAGAVGMFEQAALGAITPFEEERESRYREGIQDFFEGYTPKTRPGMEDAISRKFGEALGSFGALGITGLIPYVGLPAAVATAGAAGAGEASERARAKGATQEERNLAARLGAGVGLTEVIPTGRLFGLSGAGAKSFERIFGKSIGSQDVNWVTRRAKNIASSAGQEAAQEFLAAVGQNWIEKGIYNPEQGAFEGAVEQGAYGGGVGGFVRFFADFISPRLKGGSDLDPISEDKEIVKQDLSKLREEEAPAPAFSKQTLDTDQRKAKGLSSIFSPTQKDKQRELFPGLDLGRPPIEQLDKGLARQKELGELREQGQQELDFEGKPKDIDPVQGNLFAYAREKELEETTKKEVAENLRQQTDAQVARSEELRKLIESNEKGPDTPMKGPLLAQLKEEKKELDKDLDPADLAEAQKRDTQYEEMKGALSKQPDEIDQYLRQAQEADITNELPPKDLKGRIQAAFQRTQEKNKDDVISTPDTTTDGIGLADSGQDAGRPPLRGDDPRGITSPTPRGLGGIRRDPGTDNDPKEQGTAPLSQRLSATDLENILNPDEKKKLLDEARDTFDAIGIDVDPEALASDIDAYITDTNKNLPLLQKAYESINPEEQAPEQFTDKEGKEPLSEAAAKEATRLGLPAKALEARTGKLNKQIKKEREAEEAGLQAKKEAETYKNIERIKEAKRTADQKKILREGRKEAKDEFIKVWGDAKGLKKSVIGKRFRATQAYNIGTNLGIINIYDKSTIADIKEVTKLIKTPENKVAKYAKEAYMYFWKLPNVDAVLDIIAGDIGANRAVIERNSKEDGKVPLAIREHYSNRSTATAQKARNWIRIRLDRSTLKKLDAKIVEEKEQYIEQVNKHKERIKDEDKKAKVTEEIINDEILYAQYKEERKKSASKASAVSEKYVTPASKEEQYFDLEDTYLKKPTKKRKPDLKKKEGPNLNILNEMWNAKTGGLKLPENAVERLDLPLDYFGKQAIRSGDISLALNNIIASTYSPAIRKLASSMLKNVGSTKLKIVEGLRSAGKFSPTTNTISLNSRTGINLHTFLHELTHAITSDAIDTPSNIASKQLNTLYNNVKDRLPTYYGSQNVKEFVAEAMSNPRFQQALRFIAVDGNTMTAWQRFKNIIGNILRKLGGYPPVDIKETTTALNEVNRLFEGLIAPAPQYRDADDLNLIKGRDGLFDLLNNIQTPKQPLTKDYRNNWVKDTLELLPYTTKKLQRAFLGFLPSMSIVDLADAVGVAKPRDMDTLIRGQEKEVGLGLQAIDGTIKKITDTVPKSKMDLFNKLVALSTRNEVDPEITQQAKAKEKYGSDPDKMKDWKEIKDLWDTSTPEIQEAYKLLRKTYQKEFEKLKNVLAGRIEGIDGMSMERKRTLRKQIFSKLFEKKLVEPYFPLVRSGNYWLQFDAEGETVVMAFETPTERLKAKKQLVSTEGIDTKSISFFNPTDKKFKWGGLQTSNKFVSDALSMMNKQKVPESAREELLQMFIRSLPESSFAKAFARREGTLGFNQDAVFALKTKGYDMARQSARMKYAQLIQKEEDRLNEISLESKSEVKKNIIEEMVVRGQFAKNPPPDGAAILANRLAFTFTLGLNISSAVVNLSQIPLMFMPMLGGQYGYKKASGYITSAGKIFSNSGFKRKIDLADGTQVETFGSPSLDNYFELDTNGNYKVREDVLNNKKYSAKFLEQLKDLTTLADVAGDQLNRSIFHDTLGIQGTSRGKNYWEKFNILSAGMFHNVERFNRQIALISSYQLELDRLNSDKATASEKNLSPKQKKELAANNAVYTTQMINGGALLGTAPRWAQRGVGRVALMYKGFGIQMYYTMMKTAIKAARAMYKGNPEETAIAIKQLGGIATSSFALSGVVGMPLASMIFLINDLLQGYEDDEEDSVTRFRKEWGEGWYKGPLVAATGVDVSGRMGLNNLLFRANPYIDEWDLKTILMEGFGGPAGSTAESVFRGAKQIYNEGFSSRNVEAMLPAAVRNVLKTYRYQTEGIETRRLDEIVGDPSLKELSGSYAGFGIARKNFAQEKARVKKGISMTINQDKQDLYRKYYLAFKQGDWEGMDTATKAIITFNRKHPQFAITAKSLKSSIESNLQASTRMMAGTLFPKSHYEYFAFAEGNWEFQPDFWKSFGI